MLGIIGLFILYLIGVLLYHMSKANPYRIATAISAKGKETLKESSETNSSEATEV